MTKICLKLRWFIFVIISNHCHLITSINLKELKNSESKLSRNFLLDRLQQTLTYAAKNVESVDLNLMLGVAVAQGQLLNMNQTNLRVQKSLSLIKYLLKYSHHLIFPLGFRNASNLIFNTHLWTNIGKVTKPISCDAITRKKYFLYRENKNSPNGRQSDLCMSELSRYIGASNSAFKIMGEECIISQECEDALIGGNPWGYELLHRVLFNTIAKVIGCKETNSNDEMCCQVLQEINILVHKGVPLEATDLFIEEVLVCSMNGYHQFLRNEWIQIMLRRQNSNGCWSDFIANRKRWNRTPKKTFGSSDCSTHTTGVSIGLLALAARNSPH